MHDRWSGVAAKAPPVAPDRRTAYVPSLATLQVDIGGVDGFSPSAEQTSKDSVAVDSLGMPNGDHSPMTDAELDEFFFALLTIAEIQGKEPRPSSLEYLRRALTRGFIPELIDDVFGRCGRFMSSVVDDEATTGSGLRDDAELRDRFLSIGMGDRLVDAVVSDLSTSFFRLLTGEELRTHSWPTWEDLRARAHERGWRPDGLEEAFGKES